MYFGSLFCRLSEKLFEHSEKTIPNIGNFTGHCVHNMIFWRNHGPLIIGHIVHMLLNDKLTDLNIDA